MPKQLTLNGIGPTGPETLEGSVNRVIYANPSNDWKVVELEEDSGARHVVVGRLPGVVEGLELKVAGKWKNTKKYGPRFEAESFVVLSPATERGILKLLSSGLVDGIGKGLAKRLVDTFGAETLEVIRNEPERLRDVEGIGPKRSAQIQKALQEHDDLREVLVFLQGHGLGLVQAQKVYKRFGARAIEEVRSDPYQLVTEIRGIGFLTADRIAESLGVARDAPERIQAGLVYELTSAAEEGHCFLPRQELVQRSADRLGLPKELVDAELPEVARRRYVVVDRLESCGEAVYPIGLYHAEVGLARDLATLQRARPSVRLDPRLVARVEQRLAFRLAPEQRAALEEACRHQVLVITGGPGTGKTTLVRAIADLATQSGANTALAAPTGRASRRLSEVTGHAASTIHRLLEYSPRARAFLRNRDHPLEAQVVIVDELSMVDVLLAYRLVAALREGTRLILVGDADQLPSVGPGAVLADMVTSGSIPVVRLSRVFRQAAESRIVQAAHRINQGLLPEPGPSAGRGEFYHIETEDSERAIEILLRLVTERIPGRYGLDPVREVQVLSPVKRGDLGTENLNERLRRVLNPTVPPGPNLPFWPGDKVMQVRNDYDKDVFNGDIGIVQDLLGKGPGVVVDFEGRRVAYEPAELDELVLAYACTVHKSQGSEYPAVVLTLSTSHYIMLQRNLLYTAVTRAKRLFVSVGPRRAMQIAVSNDRIRKRYTALAERLAARAPS